MLKNFSLVLLLAALLPGCSMRRVYQPISIVQASPNSININTATVEELEKLPYIGGKTAESIVQFRTINGPFRRIEHLMQIRGVSEKRFAEIAHVLKTK